MRIQDPGWKNLDAAQHWWLVRIGIRIPHKNCKDAKTNVQTRILKSQALCQDLDQEVFSQPHLDQQLYLRKKSFQQITKFASMYINICGPSSYRQTKTNRFLSISAEFFFAEQALWMTLIPPSVARLTSEPTQKTAIVNEEGGGAEVFQTGSTGVSLVTSF